MPPSLLFLYCHFVSAAEPPPTEDVSFTLPLPTFTVSVGLAGSSGRVGAGAEATSSIVHWLSLYALKV